MTLQYFTLVHILISLAAIASGFGVLAGLLNGKLLPRWTAFFLLTTAATSITGFFFPFHGFTPAIAVGVISLLALGLAGYALFTRHLDGVWRKVFVITAVASLYFNFFVLIAQHFQKVPALAELAPTQSEPPFAITQGIVFLVFLGLGFCAVRRFR